MDRFKKASLKGWKYAFDNINETVNLIHQKYNIQNKTKETLLYEANVLKKLAYKNTNELGKIDKYRIQSTHNLYKITGITQGKLDIDNFIYQNNSYNTLQLSKNQKNYLKKKGSITMCIDPEWMPFESFKDDQHIGMTADYFKIFTETFNLPIDIVQTTTWSQSLEFAQEQKCDILSLVMQTPERKKYLNFTTPYLRVPLVLATKHNITFVSDFKTLKDEKIGIPKGYAFVELLKTKYPNINIIEVKNIKDGLQKVKDGKLFGYIGTLASIGYMFQKEFTGELKIAGKFNESWELGIGVRKDDKILLSILEKATQGISDEKHREVLNKWIAIKYEQKIDYTLLWQILIDISIIIIFSIYRQIILKKSNKDLKKAVEEKTKELLNLNQNLELKIKKAVNENREKDQLLFNQTKLASMGEMIGNIAHQWRQPLSVISTGATGLKLQKEYETLTDELFEDTCTAINNNAQYLSKTIDDFRNFIKGDRKKTIFNLSNSIESFLHLVEGSIKSENINIIKNLQDNIKINGYENELIQCYINIYNNAKDVLVNKEEDKFLFISSTIKNNKAIIKIKDNAGGIPDEVMPKIFEPYFTTKHKSQGTGLGLHMTYNLIVDGMNGNIKANNKNNEYDGKEYYGAEFTITLPIS